MIRTEENDRELATSPGGKHGTHLPASLAPFLTTHCLAAAAALQGLGVVSSSPFLLAAGSVLAVIGLGAYAAVRSGNVENGWAYLGVVPIFGLLIGYAVLRFRPPLDDAPLNALRGAAHAVLVGMTLMASVALVAHFMLDGREIRGEVPDDFPILAVVPEHDDATLAAYVVPKRELEAFTRENPDFSYLVPKHSEASLHENLRNYDSSSIDLFDTAYFKVREISADRQALEVRFPIHPEAHTVGWYEATARGIEPKRYLFFHDMMAGFVGPPALGIAAVIYSLITWLLNRRFWPRFTTPA